MRRGRTGRVAGEPDRRANREQGRRPDRQASGARDQHQKREGQEAAHHQAAFGLRSPAATDQPQGRQQQQGCQQEDAQVADRRHPERARARRAIVRNRLVQEEQLARDVVRLTESGEEPDPDPDRHQIAEPNGAGRLEVAGVLGPLGEVGRQGDVATPRHQPAEALDPTGVNRSDQPRHEQARCPHQAMTRAAKTDQPLTGFFRSTLGSVPDLGSKACDSRSALVQLPGARQRTAPGRWPPKTPAPGGIDGPPH